jgi:glycosyltransferase involved in cell wall biosynthesis
MSPTVSVVMPNYNASEYVQETIESVLQQTFVDFEFLVIDDGSTDDSVDIIQRYSQQDSRIKLFTQSNQGVSITRNNGIQKASGEFIAFLDSDDIWLPDTLATHVQHLTANPSLGLSFGRVEFMSSDSKPTGKYSNSRLRNLKPKHLYEENHPITPSNAVIRRAVLEQIGGFDKDLGCFADAELFLRVICHGWKIEGLNQVLVYYRINSGGMSSQLYRMEEEWERFSQQAQAYAPELVNQYYNQAKAMLLRYLARRVLRLGLSSEIGVAYINRALRHDWKLLLKEPRRTVLTTLALYSQYLMQGYKFRSSLNSQN